MAFSIQSLDTTHTVEDVTYGRVRLVAYQSTEPLVESSGVESSPTINSGYSESSGDAGEEFEDEDFELPIGDNLDITGEATEKQQDSILLPFFGRMNVSEIGMPLFTVAVGLVDGFNPCAMWVLLFLLSILVNLRDRVRILAVAGTFVLISGLAYMFDDSLMVLLVVFTLGKRKLQQREGEWLKLISGLVILLLGLVMIFKPEWLH